jgi:hypothetical protein
MATFLAWVFDSVVLVVVAGFLYWVLARPGIEVLLLVAVQVGALLGAYFIFLSGLETPGRRFASYLLTRSH